MTRPLSERSFDVVLFGATGFTGKLVAEYLAQRGPAAARWAIAGRSAAKLEAVKRDLVRLDASLEGVRILVADSHDEAALTSLARDTRVVCTTVGPYGQYGRTVARVCAREGTSYCDLTGEVPFIRRSIEDNAKIAEETGARIVHACGFDSVPFDLGVYLAYREAKRRDEDGLVWAKGYAGRMKGGFSGGTIASMIDFVEAARTDPEMRRLVRDAHALEPGHVVSNDPFEADQHGVRFDDDLGRWTAPFVMSVVNTRVVRRSNALLGYGDAFRYNEAMSMPKGPVGFAFGSLVTAGMTAFAVTLALRPTRTLLAKTVLPKPGEGPSREARDKGYFECHFLAESERGGRIRTRVAGDSDPGYGETAKMLGESALCLAEDADALEPRYGVLTPASAMGDHLVARLRAAGMTLEVTPA